MIRLLLAILAAISAVPLAAALLACILIGPYDPEEAALLIVGISLATFAHVLALGLPAFFALRRLGLLKARTMAAAGLVIGMLPLAAITWPYPIGERYRYSSAGSWHGQQVEFVADGLPTVYGWLSYLEGVAIFGLLGVVGALAFWFAWAYRRPAAALPISPDVRETTDGFRDPQMK